MKIKTITTGSLRNYFLKTLESCMWSTASDIHTKMNGKNSECRNVNKKHHLNLLETPKLKRYNLYNLY